MVESFNRAAGELFGYEENEAVGQPFGSMVARKGAGREERSATDMLQHTYVGRSQEWIGYRKDGTTFSMELDLSDVQLETRKVHIGCLRDISERQTYTETLQHQALHDRPDGPPEPRAVRRPREQRDPRGLRHEGAARAARDGPRRLQARQRHARPPAAATSCSSWSPSVWSTACATATPSRGSAATSSGSSCSAAATWPAPPPSPGRSRRRSSRRSSSTGTTIDVQGEHRHHARARARRQHRRPAAPRRSGDVRRQAARAAATRCSRPSRRTRPRAGSRCSATCATASSATSSSCTTSRRSTS